MPNRLDVLPPEGMTRVVFEWFSEGVAEFGARRLMLETGLIDADSYARLFNDDLERIRFSAVRSASAADLMAAAQGGRFNSGYKKLAYYRGSLMALKWDTALRRAGHTDGLFHLLDILRARRDADNRVPAEVLFTESAALGLDVRGDFERFIVRGERLIPPGDLLAPGHRIVESLKPSRDLGFDLPASQATKIITGVRPGGPAEVAGLRDGMSLIRTENASTDVNGARLHDPVVLHVSVDGESRQIAYLAEGPLQSAFAFVRVAGD